MDYKDFKLKIKGFQQSIQQNQEESDDEYSEILFQSTHRKIFAIYNHSSQKTKLTVEVHTTIPYQSYKIIDQPFLTSQLHTMIDLYSYLLQLQEQSFVIDVLPEESFWYASIELLSSSIDEQVVATLNLHEEVL